MTDSEVTDELPGAKDAALEALYEALDAGDGHPHVTSMLVGGTSDDRADVFELVGMRAAGRGWLVLTDTGTPGLVHRLRVAVDSLRQAINSVSPSGYGVAGRTRSLRDALEARGPSVAQPGAGLLITINDAHTLPPDELVEVCHTIQHVTQRQSREVMWVLAGDDVLHYRFTALPGVAFMMRAGSLRLPTPETAPSEPWSDARAANNARAEQLKQGLVEAGGVTVEAFGERRQIDPDAALILARDFQDAGRLVVAEHNGAHLIPGCLLDEDLLPIRLWQQVVRTHLDAGYSPWDVWIWIATPTTWLDDQIPSDLIHADPERVLRAVENRLLAAGL